MNFGSFSLRVSKTLELKLFIVFSCGQLISGTPNAWKQEIRSTLAS